MADIQKLMQKNIYPKNDSLKEKIITRGSISDCKQKKISKKLKKNTVAHMHHGNNAAPINPKRAGMRRRCRAGVGGVLILKTRVSSLEAFSLFLSLLARFFR